VLRKGEVRYLCPSGYTTANSTLPTRYTYTGQYSYISDPATDLGANASFGLMFYNARWYDPALGRFASADSLIPGAGSSQAWDRYAYTMNNPLRYIDPTGHCPWCIAVGVGALVGAAVGYGAQVYDNYQHGVTGVNAFTTNISAEPIVNGAFIGAGAVLGVGLIATAPILAAPAAAAGGACADGDCTNEANALVGMGEEALGSPEAQSLAQKIATAATQHPDSPWVSLGKNGLYQKSGYTYFDLPSKAWDILSNGGTKFVETVNGQFMSSQMAAAKGFIVSLGGEDPGAGTAFELGILNAAVKAGSYLDIIKNSLYVAE
jgi:RHS repeat-associated protein